MLAIIFAIDTLLGWTNTKLSDAFTAQTLLLVWLFCLALHLARPVGSWPWRTRRRL
jgi:hypothetical protein